MYIYYKRRCLYHCSAKAPLLEGSGNRHLYPLKGTSFDRVYLVFGARVDLGCFALRQKRIRGGRTYAECNSGSLKTYLLLGDPAIVSLPRLDRRDTMGLLSSTRLPHTRCALSCIAAGMHRGGREGWEGGEGSGGEGRGREGRGDGRGVEGRGWEGRGGEGRGGEGRGGEGRGGEGDWRLDGRVGE